MGILQTPMGFIAQHASAWAMCETLVREAAALGIEVIAVPGPTAMASALSVSGFDTREFAFYGFLPRQKKELEKKLLAMKRSSTWGMPK